MYFKLLHMYSHYTESSVASLLYYNHVKFVLPVCFIILKNTYTCLRVATKQLNCIYLILYFIM